MIVISDTTPILSLLKAGHLELLEKLYGNVLVPNAVYHELTEKVRKIFYTALELAPDYDFDKICNALRMGRDR